MRRKSTISLDQRRLARRLSKPRVGEAADDGEGQVLAHALGEQEALAAAVLRHQRDAVAAGRAPGAGLRCEAGLPQSSTLPRGAAGAEERLEELALAVALQAADAEDLALAEVEADAGERGRWRSRGPCSATRPVAVGDALGIEAVEAAADHLR